MMQEVNVKVAVRVRPLLGKEKLNGEQVCIRMGGSPNQVIVGTDKAFTFDHVLFNTSQQDVYTLCVEPLVHSIFDGYNATVFAYGQTGSGKTYTIGGGDITPLTEDEYGIIPRALTHMFKIMEMTENKTFTVHVSYIEIYMEELRDLLSLETSPKDLHVREDSKGNTVIVGAREVECESLDEVMSLLESGSAARHTGFTQMNEQSSRSHSIFTVVIGQNWSEPECIKEKSKKQLTSSNVDGLENEDISHYMSGKFCFVDLAGSERAHKTGNIGDRFKESIYINSGLLSLGNVISALGDVKKKPTHIPYRDSKITRLLKDSLGGNAKTLMICCVSPSSSSFDESLNSLKYANRARNIRNKPIINRDIQSIRFEEMQSEIKALREELARQRTTMSMYPDQENQVQFVNNKDLEEKISKLQVECANYRMIAEEAYKHILDIQERDIVSKSQNLRLKDWMDLLEEIKNSVPDRLCHEELQTETIQNLQHELEKCRFHLRSDETIFAEKTREVNHLNDTLKEVEKSNKLLESHLAEMTSACQRQAEQLISQQIRIDELETALKMLNQSSVSTEETSSLPSLPVFSGKRPKSVPAKMHYSKEDSNLLRPPSRLIKTSPALFTLERVMQSFRARSQLLISRLEDSDEVLHQTFTDSEEEENNEIIKKNEKIQRKNTFNVKQREDKSSNKAQNNEDSASSTDFTNTIASRELIRSSTRLIEKSAEWARENQESSRLINIDVQSSAEIHRKLIKQSQLKALEAHQKIRDLSINIRMKEQLIRELVKSEKDAELMNKQYAEKIKGLEKEKMAAKRELAEVQTALQMLETKDKAEVSNIQKLEIDYKKKIEEAKAKVAALQKKQKETEKVANFAHQHEKKIQDLELAIDRMKQQQEQLNKKLKEEMEQKVKLEKEMQREVQRVKDLEIRDEQTQKVLKRKTEELASAKRRLRSASGVLPPITSEEQEKLEEQRKWLDAEVEKVLEQRRQNETLEQELKQRETILAKKEAIIAEKSELEMKKLRSSQALNKSLVLLSSKLDSVERKLEEKKKELPEVTEDRRSHVIEEIQKLQKTKDKINKERSHLDKKLKEGKILSVEEERKLIEMDEAIEALDAAIVYKNENIYLRQMEVRQSSDSLIQNEEHLLQKLNSLTNVEIRALLSRYFDKVVSLRDEERKLHLRCSEMEMKTDEQDRLIMELKGALQRSAMELDRKLTQQQRDYEQKIQLLMHQLTERVGDTNIDSLANKDNRIQNLEKDLYYYKKTARDMRTKIKQLLYSGVISPSDAEGLVGSSTQSLDAEVATPRSHVQKSVTDPATPRYSNQSQMNNTSRKALNSSSETRSITTPVKISRRDLRPMSEEEVYLRRSGLSSRGHSRTPQDSLEEPSPKF
ncbi:kinesin-like protein KIF27 isoform X1 [Biomphalaria glabrata]|uniref:Kinesin-like protein KIF27 isoform X1 n=1 Tax=Biomphalaria glabrata TaxID=6526 RepID=A0A9W3BIQ6_BIOGL|nr:kinesin-like protein KIF27 isoform X1 [Biomphalaria glabrata]XP_055899312.1 kinesin-like protein KIF27 isoform X1 [Biomphalaria glabrata]XP_055899313.1 kinesin-like protein KIF27 isoform X1 [Biomphalaria glabrata]XP_055899314.1 kinesin-like protein KIF27 isoform X1 [Biomphalaria glabrata]KAI8784176.1 kinesin protein KIF27 isoform X1 [Biomphalaria glabrata]